MAAMARVAQRLRFGVLRLRGLEVRHVRYSIVFRATGFEGAVVLCGFRIQSGFMKS